MTNKHLPELRKGLFLQSFYTIKDFPSLVNSDNSPSDFALAASFWNEPIPTSLSDIQSLAIKGYHLVNKHSPLPMLDSSKSQLILLSQNKVRVPLARKGSWHHQGYGVVSFDDSDFNSIIDNYHNDSLGFTPYITYGHLDEEHNSTDSSRKRGNLCDFIVNDDILYGDFEVKDDTYQCVKNGEYEYSSGEFLRNYLDKSSGSRKGTAFMRVALTNSPFIPFGDNKVQALSSLSDSHSSHNYFVMGLSNNINSSPMDNPNSDNLDTLSPPNDSDNTESLTQDKVEHDDLLESSPPNDNLPTLPEQTEEVNQVNSVDELPSLSPQTPEVLSSVTNVDTLPPSIDKKEFNMEDLISQVKDIYDSQLKAAQDTILSLTAQVESLAGKLSAQEQVTQAFSANMSKAAEYSLYKKLSDAGVSPANVQKFSTLKSAIESASLNSSVVKLSNNSGEFVESNLIQAIADVITDIASSDSISYQQFGVSSKPSGSGSSFDDIIKRNKDKATKTSFQ